MSVESNSCQLRRAARTWLRTFSGLLLALMFLSLPQAFGAIQFDVFLGFDGVVPEASWFPVVFEVKNDGPAFKGTIELEAGSYNVGQKRMAEVELPTGTLKRLVIPVFASTRGYSTWDARLLDEKGKVRAEQTGLQARKQLAPGTALMGALPRTPTGAPAFQGILSSNPELQPTSARLLPSIFPDNPLVLEGLGSIYLNSERAADLTLNQVNALLAWMNAGGHLIIGVEQPSDISSSPWLKTLFPCEVKDLRPVQSHDNLQAWLTQAPAENTLAESAPDQTAAPPANPAFRARYGAGGRPLSPSPAAPIGNPFSDLPSDANFEKAEMQVATGTLRGGKVEVSAGDLPLVISVPQGRGELTALLFSPEREPVRSWKNLPAFWAKLARVPGGLYASKSSNPQGGWSSDGIFGAMIDSRQVHKLPVGWLLMLLLVYLVVIGPFDQYWLKRIGKPMLTWITFPAYVVAFSLVIYLIGYKLRAGESEWNELHVVDVLANGEHTQLRGRTYCSVYSPSNQRYGLSSHQSYATLRGEFAGLWGGGEAGEKATIQQNGDNFKAQIFVPVWTSELFVTDWWSPGEAPVNASVSAQGEGWQVRVENHGDSNLTNLQLAVAGRIVALGDLPRAQSLVKVIKRDDGVPLRTFVWNFGGTFSEAITSRRQALGTSEGGQISDLPNSSMAVSFLSQIAQGQNYQYNFIAPPGLDLSGTVQQGRAVVLAWGANQAPIKPMYEFSPRRSHRDTLWRVPVMIE